MAKFTISQITDKKTWENFVLSQKPHSFLQSWNWGETNKKAGHEIYRLGFFSSKNLVGICLLVEERAKRGPHFYVSGGPLLDWQNKALVTFTVVSLKEFARQKKTWFIRMRPEILPTKENLSLIKSLGFVPSPMHLHAENTWIVPINKTNDEILSQMRKTTRYLTRKSFEEGYSAEIMNNTKGVDILYKLQTETVSRHKFVGFSKRFFQSELDAFLDDDQIILLVIRKGKKVMAASLVIFYGGTAYYHFSGSSNDSTKTNASYFLQWNIIQEAIKRKCEFYNMWGIAPEGVSHHRFSGVTLFKTGFGGKRIDWLHAVDLPVSPRYWLTHTFEKLRKRFRKL
jgi:lipid II:glycine glycyltransferase (peptidoglycan interpeptide bridge formation enzyme)